VIESLRVASARIGPISRCMSPKKVTESVTIVRSALSLPPLRSPLSRPSLRSTAYCFSSVS